MSEVKEKEVTVEDLSKREINVCTSNMSEIRFVLAQMVTGINAGPKSRARSLVVTKLEEAGMWAGEAMRTDP